MRLKFLTLTNEDQRNKLVQYEGRIETQRVSNDVQKQELGELEVALKNTTEWKKF